MKVILALLWAYILWNELNVAGGNVDVVASGWGSLRFYGPIVVKGDRAVWEFDSPHGSYLDWWMGQDCPTVIVSTSGKKSSMIWINNPSS